MTGGLQQFARVLDSIPVHYCRERPIDVHADMIATCSDEEWFALMAEKYGEDFEARDFTLGPANPTLPTIKDSM